MPGAGSAGGWRPSASGSSGPRSWWGHGRDHPEAEALGCAAGQCVTVVERTHFDGDGRAVETSDIVVRADRWRLEYDIPFTS
ncbi:UTRA domain-containing protein [Streptomyces stramineus]